MKTVNSLSGGKTSSFMAINYPADLNIYACVCINYQKAAPKDKAVLNYCLDKLNGNFVASAESEKTLKVMMNLEQLIGREIIWVRGKSFDQIIDESGCLPSWSRRFCTTDMKILPMFEHIYFNHGMVRMNIGFRADEFERVHTIEKGKKPSRKIDGFMKYPISCRIGGANRMQWDEVLWQKKSYPLYDNLVFHKQVLDYWNENHPEFDFPRSSNCQGCHHKSPQLIQLGHQTEPAILDWFALQEKKGKYNTWHDDQITYEKKFQMKFTQEIPFDVPMCNSGGCTD